MEGTNPERERTEPCESERRQAHPLTRERQTASTSLSMTEGNSYSMGVNVEIGSHAKKPRRTYKEILQS